MPQPGNHKVNVQRLETLEPSVPVLHVYGQPADPDFLKVQGRFATDHPWFAVQKLSAKSHFPMLEIPEDMAKAIESFAAQT